MRALHRLKEQKHLLLFPKDKSACSFPLSPFWVFKMTSSLAFSFFLDSISLSPGLLLSPLKATLPSHPSGDLQLGQEPSTSAASTAQTYSLLPSLSSVPTVTEATLPKVASDSPSANAVTFSQSSSCSTFLSVSHCRPSLLRFFGKSIFASITLQSSSLSLHLEIGRAHV